VSGEGAALLVDLSPVQHGEGDGATPVEECAASLVAAGAVRALLLDPSAPVPGTLHSRLFGSGLLRWNTAREVRRAGDTVYVAFAGAVVPPHVERLGVPVVTVRAEGAHAAQLALEAARGLQVRAVSRLRVAVVASRSTPVVDALRDRCNVVLIDEDSPDTQWSGFDGVVHLLGTSAADAFVLRVALRVPGVVWLQEVSLAPLYRFAGDDVDAAAQRMYGDRAPGLPLSDEVLSRYGLLMTSEVVRAAQAVVLPSEEALRRVVLDNGGNGPLPPLSVCSAADPVVAAELLLALVSA
jgi:hypothetical protein